jgi:hypothetical protein
VLSENERTVAVTIEIGPKRSTYLLLAEGEVLVPLEDVKLHNGSVARDHMDAWAQAATEPPSIQDDRTR